MTSNQDKTFKGLITQIIAVLSEDKRYLTFINHGQLEYNAFSITFWVNFEGLGVQNSVYIKIPKYIFYDKSIDFLSPITAFDRELAENELNSLKYLSNNWNKSCRVSFVNHLAYIYEYNAIVTERVFGSLLFEEFRRHDLLKKYKKPNNDLVMNGLYNFGKSLKLFHEKSSLSSTFKIKDVINKFDNYFIFLKSSGVSSKYLKSFFDIFIQFTDHNYHTLTSNNLKGIDIRQIFITNSQSLYVIDPGKLSQGYIEIDLARFVVTCRIIYWGTLRAFFHHAPHVSFEEKFLNGYFGAGYLKSKTLNILILKEFFKQWQVVHSALSRRNWPFFIKYFIKKLYIDPFYKWQIARGLSELINSK